MEPTEAQLMTAYEAFTDAGGEMDIDGPFTGNQAAIEAAVRAVFAAVPDPIVWGDRLPDRYAHSSMGREMQYLADDLRMFMRGGDN